MRLTYNAGMLQHAVQLTRPIWGGQGGVGRYYAPPTFISRDPMFEKYPSISPYTYCANNPMKYVDPTGKTVVITGDAADNATSTLSTKNITVSRDEKTGKLSVEGKAKTRDERLLVRAINSTRVRINVTANNSDVIRKDENGNEIRSNGGSFDGNTVFRGVPNYRKTIDGQNKEAAFAIANQFVTMDGLKKNFYSSDFGAVITHEITEAFFGALISIKTGKEAGPAMHGQFNPIYEKAHQKASTCPLPKPKEEKNDNTILLPLPSPNPFRIF